MYTLAWPESLGRVLIQAKLYVPRPLTVKELVENGMLRSAKHELGVPSFSPHIFIVLDQVILTQNFEPFLLLVSLSILP